MEIIQRKTKIRLSVIILGLSYFFILINPFGWNMLIHLFPFYIFFVIDRSRINNGLSRVKKYCVPFIFFSIYAILSMVFISSLDGTSGKVIRIIYEMIILVLFTSYQFSRRELDYFIKCSIASGCLIGLKMIIQGSVWPTDEMRHVITNFGKKMDPNFLAASIILPILWEGYVCLRYHFRKKNVILFCMLAVIILATGSRGAALAVFIGCLILYLSNKCTRRHLLAGFIIIFSAIIVYINLPEYVSFRFSINSIHNDSGSNYLRFNLWRSCYHIFQSSPIIGRGGNSMLNYGMEYGAFRNLMAHNTYLEMLADYGVLGFLLFISVIIDLIVKAINHKQFFVLALSVSTVVCSIFISANHAAFFWQNIMLGYVWINVFTPIKNKGVSYEH